MTQALSIRQTLDFAIQARRDACSAILAAPKGSQARKDALKAEKAAQRLIDRFNMLAQEYEALEAR